MKAFAPFRLDPANQCLWRTTASGEDERVLLTPSEFAVLDYLVAHAGRLVTHQELLDAVWPGTAIEPQAVKSKIFHLRRALDDDPKNPRFIETLARRGYRFLRKLDEPVADATPAPAGTRLVGREAVLAELWQCLRQAGAGKLQVVFITGEPGIGKTAVAEEFLRQVAASDRATRVAHGQCVEGLGSKEGFYPVLEALGELWRGPDAGQLVDTLAAHAPTWLVQFPALLTRQHRETLKQEILGATRERMLREICEALEAIAVSSPLLLVLEDLHWADASTLDLISALARRRMPARIMLVATYRPTDAARSTQPLHSVKRDLVARQLCREMVLDPLTETEIAAYLSGGQSAAGDTRELASLIRRHTEGNPLFMIAVLDHLVERGFVRRDDGWRLQRPAADISLEVPESLRDMIAAQIERLGEPEQRMLEVAAIGGMTFAPAIAAPSGDMDVVPFDDCCDALARRGHILRLADTRQLPDGTVVQRYAFAHALYREVLYARQAPARRATLHRRRAERLEQVFAAALDEATTDLALHFEKGADWPRAVKYLRRAADLAASRGVLEEARVNLQHALELAERLPLSERSLAETGILNELADMYLGTFDPRAVDVLTLLRERAARYGLVDVEAKALVDLAYPLAWGSRDRGLEVIEEALRLSYAQAEPLFRARIRAPCMMRRIWTTGWSADDAAEGARELAGIRRRGTEQDAAWHVIDGYVVGLFSSAYRSTIRELVEALAILTRGHGDGMYLSYAHSVREFIVPWCRILLGEWGEALRELDAAIALAEKNGDAYRTHTLLLIRALGLLHAMNFAAVRAICDSLLPALEHPGRAPWRRWCLTIGGAAEVGLGNREAALDRLMTAGEEMDRHAVLGDWYWRLYQRWALTNLSLSIGDLARARDDGESFLASAKATAERTWQGLAWVANARIALASGDARRAQDLITSALATIEGVEVPVAAWQVHATAADLARGRGDDAAAARHREASGEIVLGLAASLGPKEEELRRTFLAASPVAKVLAGSPHGPLDREDRAAAV